MDASVTDLLAEGGFRAGLVLGGIVAVASVVRAAARQGRRLPIGGAFAAAVVAGFLQQSILETGLVVGLVALAGTAVLPTDTRASRVLATVPGAVLIAVSTDRGIASWETVAVLVVVIVGGPLLAEFDRTFAPTGVVPALVAVSAAGGWATVPETEHAVVLAGVSVPLAVLGWPRWRASLGSPGALLIAGLIAWTVVADGAFRPSAVVGGLACLGVLVLEPVVRRGGPHLQGRWVPALVLVHLTVVAVSSRVAGLRSSAAAALVIVAATYAVAAVVIAALTVQQGHER